MSIRSIMLSLVALSGSAVSLAAQGPSLKVAGLSPAECTKAINSWRQSEVAPTLGAYTAASAAERDSLAKPGSNASSATATKTAALAKYQTASAAATTAATLAAGECARQFDPLKVASAELPDLITLYTSARDTTRARVATDRLLAATDLPPAGRARAIILGINRENVRDPSYFGIIEGSERLIEKLDQLAEKTATRELDSLSMMAHQTMLGRYEYLDVAPGLRNHATKLIALSRKLDKPSTMISGYHSLARSYADMLRPDSAMMILDMGEKEIGAAATKSFADFRNRYALIGKPASAVSARWWINGDRTTDLVPGNGKVTLMEFTAHWCGPCKNSYPGLQQVAARFKDQPFQGVMVTQLYGYLGTQRPLNPEQEVAADREYFGKEHNVPFPVAINQQTETGIPFKIDAATGLMTGGPIKPKPDDDYRVGGIPQLVIIDKKGVIRQIVTGWDQGNTERFTKMIQALLDEK